MLNALVSTNLFDAAHSVSGRGQAHLVIDPARKVGEAQADTKLPNTGVVCGSLDSTRPDGTPDSDAGLVG